MTLLVLIVGELQALDALASEHPEDANAKTVYTAVAIGLLLIAFLALLGAPGRLERGESEDD